MGKLFIVISHNSGSTKYTKKVNTMIDTIFIKKPLLTISGILKYPEPKTTAFGGVATGNIKAQDAATAAPTINTNGCTSIVIAIGAKTGNNIAVVARFDVISVKKLTAAISTKTNTKTGNPDNEVI
jgi:hypothetical protein